MAFLSTLFKGTAVVVVVAGIGGGVKSCVFDENPDNLRPTQKFTQGATSTVAEMFSAFVGYFKDPQTQRDLQEGTKSVLDTAGRTTNSILGGTADFMEEQAAKMEQEEKERQRKRQPEPPGY